MSKESRKRWADYMDKCRTDEEKVIVNTQRAEAIARAARMHFISKRDWPDMPAIDLICARSFADAK